MRSATLEEVFITLGEMEKAEEEKEGELRVNAEGDDDLDTFVPDVEENTSGRLFTVSLKLHM